MNYSGVPRGRRRTPLWPFFVTAVLVAVVVAGFVVFMRGDGKPDCDGTIRLRMAASQDTVGLLQRAADDYGRKHTVGGKCVAVTVDSKNSGTAMNALVRGWNETADGPRPDIWSPASSVWVTLLRQRAQGSDKPVPVAQGAPQSIMTSPLTIAMPKPMAEAIGWPAKAIGWEDLAKLAQDPKGWASYGHPEWGRFKLGKTNPNLSTSGLNATVGAYFASAGTTADLTVDDVSDSKNQTFVRNLERSIVHYGDTTLTFLSALQRADDRGRALSYISAVTVEEDSVWAYNQGDPTGDPALLGKHPKPKTPLVAIYPKEGTIYSDHPYVALTWMDAEKQKASDDFLAYLHGDEAQRGFQNFGYRGWQGKPGSEINQGNGLLADGPKGTLNVPSAPVLSALLDAWGELRKPAKVLLVVDRSGSMKEGVPGTGKTKLDLARSAAADSLAEFRGQDKVGLWMFSSKLKGEQDWQELQPVASVDAGHRGALKRSLTTLGAGGATGLYNTTAAAYDAMRAGREEDSINAVVVLTDGKNERPGGLDLPALISKLSDQQGEQVRVFTIAYGQDADQAVLRQIAESTDGAEYDSSNPNGIREVLTEVVSNF
ncbi:substrate-binding and VWA domain-containing protein [Actinomadura scrupuli]|uniref:substrate-binding and VWA domain-containing protein n=1 Tax=Actinomadura scrupuli TaxID=559629 RepID=UPI003D964AE9